MICYSTGPNDSDFLKINKNGMYCYTFLTKSSLLYLYFLCINLFLVTHNKLMNQSQTLRKAALNVIGTYVKIR